MRAVYGIAFLLWCGLLERWDRRWQEMMRVDPYRGGGSEHG